MDLTDCRIPNFFILLGLPVGLAYRVFILMDRNYLEIAAAILLPLIIFFPFFVIHAFGAGDIKLFMVVGSFVSPQNMILCIFWTCVTGAFIGLLKMFVYGNFGERIRYFLSYVKNLVTGIKNKDMTLAPYFVNGETEEKKRARLHFSIPILLGTVIAMEGLI